MTKTPEPVDTRALILEKARGLFLAQGYHNTSMRGIAQAAGISTGPLYFHFRNKVEVFFHICCEAFDMLLADFRREAASDEHAARRLRKIYQAYQAFYYREPQLFEIMHLPADPSAGIGLPENLQQTLKHKSLEMVQIMMLVIQEGVSLGQLRPVDPRKLALYLHAVAEGVFLSNRSGMFELCGVGLDEMIATAIELIGMGMVDRRSIEKDCPVDR